MATIEKSIDVNAPVRTVYNQWTQFEEFPKFMDSVREVRQIDDTHLHWCVEAGGKQLEWDVEITEQVPDQSIAWQTTNGTRSTAHVRFTPVGEDRTTVVFTMDYPNGAGKNVKIQEVAQRAEDDLRRFAQFVEQRGQETGAWRGEVHQGHTTGEQDQPSRAGQDQQSSGPSAYEQQAQRGREQLQEGLRAGTQAIEQGQRAMQDVTQKAAQSATQSLDSMSTAMRESMGEAGDVFSRSLQNLLRMNPLIPSASQTPMPGTWFSSMFSAWEEPFSMMRRMSEQFDREVESLMWGAPGTARRALAARAAPMWTPSVDVAQRGQDLVITVDLPGVRAEDLDVQINEGHLVISGERRSENTQTSEQGVKVIERTCGRFMRSIPVPEGVQASDAQASMNEGVLEIVVPLPRENQRRIEVKAGSRSSSASSQQGQGQESQQAVGAGQPGYGGA